MKKLLIVVLLFVSFKPSICLAQVDSLLSAIQSKTPTEKIDAMLGYMRSTHSDNPDQAIKVGDMALDIATEIKNDTLATKILYAQGYIRWNFSRYKEAITFLDKSYQIARRNQFKEDISKIANLKAICYTFLAQYDLALNNNFEALSLNEKLGSKEDISISCHNIGLVYFKLKNYEVALDYLLRSLKIKKEVNSTFDLAKLYLNIALCYNQLEDYASSEVYLKSGLKECKDNCSVSIKLSAAACYARIYFNNKNFDEAEARYIEGINLAKNSNETLLFVEMLTGLGEVYKKKGVYDKALTNLNEAEQLSRSNSYHQNLANIYEQKSELHSLRKEYEVAALYSRRYIGLRDSLLNESVLKNMTIEQTKFAERENLEIIKEKERSLKSQRIFSYTIAGLVILCFLFIYMLLKSSRTIRRLNSKLAQEVEKKTNELTAVNLNLKQVNAELNNLIQKTSNDILGPLATIKGICNVAILDMKDPLALSLLNKLDISADKLSQVLEKFTHVNEVYNKELRPVSIDLNAMARNIIEKSKVNQKTAIRNNNKDKHIDIQLQIDPITDFRTEQNLLYYALSGLVEIALKNYDKSPNVNSYIRLHTTRRSNRVLITVQDNGVGIPDTISGDDLFKINSQGLNQSLSSEMSLFVATISTRRLQGKIHFNRAEDYSYNEFVLDLPINLSDEEGDTL